MILYSSLYFVGITFISAHSTYYYFSNPTVLHNVKTEIWWLGGGYTEGEGRGGIVHLDESISNKETTTGRIFKN